MNHPRVCTTYFISHCHQPIAAQHFLLNIYEANMDKSRSHYIPLLKEFKPVVFFLLWFSAMKICDTDEGERLAGDIWKSTNFGTSAQINDSCKKDAFHLFLYCCIAHQNSATTCKWFCQESVYYILHFALPSANSSTAFSTEYLWSKYGQIPKLERAQGQSVKNLNVTSSTIYEDVPATNYNGACRPGATAVRDALIHGHFA